MRRMHLFEFEDLTWFSPTLRNYVTDYLRFVSVRFNIYEVAVPILQRGLAASGGSQIVDLGSGGGGGWSPLAAGLRERVPELRVILTDLYPNREALESVARTQPAVFAVEQSPVDATDVPSRLHGLRTQFVSFHHFQPDDARRILANAVSASAPIAIFEAQERTIGNLLRMVLTPLFVWLFTPWIRPFRWGRLVFTYLLPVVPAVVLWDGVVSVLRTYTERELRALANDADPDELFEWDIGTLTNRGLAIPYLLGLPKHRLLPE
jgi:hypothetical protein